MTAAKKKLMIAALTIPVIAYLFAAIFKSDFWGNIVSPVCAYAGAAALLYIYIKSNRKIKTNISYLLLSAACLAWAIGDTGWAVLSFMGQEPSESIIISVIYSFPNLFVLLALSMFVYFQFSKWNYVQLFIDILFIGYVISLFVFIIFFNKDFSKLFVLLQNDITSLFAIVSDTVIIIIAISWLMSVRGGKIPNCIMTSVVGVILYAITDMAYYYIVLKSVYVPNSAIDFIYVVSLYMMALGALQKFNRESTLAELYNIGYRKGWYYFVIYPVIAIILRLTNFIEVDLNIADIFVFAIAAILYKASCRYVHLSVENERLLENEKNINELLEKRVAKQISELAFLANQDTLTTLYNRRYFINCVEDNLKSKRPNEIMALMILDLDRFKAINDTFGHDFGDRVLVVLANRMLEWNHYGAVFARLGGDEFAVMFIGKYTQEEIEGFCSEIIDFCNTPIKYNNITVCISASIGIATVTSESIDSKTLMKNADIAMYRAKTQGNSYLFYNPNFCGEIKKNSEIEVLLKRANIEQDFELHYQPQFSLPDKRLIGAEALLRWNSAEYGYIPPNQFIPVAEEINYIFKLGNWIMREALQRAVSWNHGTGNKLKIGFNVSPKQLNDDKFIDILHSLINFTGADPKCIDAEITENVMINDVSKVRNLFDIFRELGISVSIDDFGSGYSALGYLSELKFDRIKIDRTIIEHVSRKDKYGINVVKAVISIAKAVGVKTLAEGVETQEQLDILIELGCDQVQGFLLGEPMPADEFEEIFLELPKSNSA